MLIMTYAPDKDMKKFECTDGVEICVEDGKTVSEMINACVRMLLAMGYSYQSIQGYVNTDEYPFVE